MVIEGEDIHRHAARRLRESFSADLPDMRLTLDPALAEGEFAIVARGNGIEVRGGPFSGVIYGVEETIQRSNGRLDPATFATEITGKPGLAYRTFWTWDHSTNWELSRSASRRSASSTRSRSRPAASSPTTSGWSISARSTVSAASPSMASCATAMAVSKRRRSSADTPMSVASASSRASLSAPMAASTGRASTSTTSRPG